MIEGILRLNRWYDRQPQTSRMIMFFGYIMAPLGMVELFGPIWLFGLFAVVVAVLRLMPQWVRMVRDVRSRS